MYTNWGPWILWRFTVLCDGSKKCTWHNSFLSGLCIYGIGTTIHWTPSVWSERLLQRCRPLFSPYFCVIFWSGSYGWSIEVSRRLPIFKEVWKGFSLSFAICEGHRTIKGPYHTQISSKWTCLASWHLFHFSAISFKLGLSTWNCWKKDVMLYQVIIGYWRLCLTISQVKWYISSVEYHAN